MVESCKHCKTKVVDRDETYNVKGEPITVESKVVVCDHCGQDVFSPEIDDENLRKAYAEYRKQHNILDSGKIREIRLKYGLSQRAFAALIGCTQATLHRYETGAIPDKSYDRMISLMDKPANVRELLQEHRADLDGFDIQALEKRLDDLEDEFGRAELFTSVARELTRRPSLDTGYRRFDLEKTAAMIRYISEKCKDLYKTKLMKILWYADMVHYRDFSTSISGLAYARANYGPVVDQHELLIGAFSTAGYIKTDEDEGQSGTIILTGPVPSNAVLSEDERATIDVVLDSIGHCSAKAASDISHKEAGWINTDNGKIISYGYADEITSIPEVEV